MKASTASTLDPLAVLLIVGVAALPGTLVIALSALPAGTHERPSSAAALGTLLIAEALATAVILWILLADKAASASFTKLAVAVTAGIYCVVVLAGLMVAPLISR